MSNESNIIIKNNPDSGSSQCFRIKNMFLSNCSDTVLTQLTDTKIMNPHISTNCKTIKNIWLVCEIKNRQFNPRSS